MSTATDHAPKAEDNEVVEGTAEELSESVALQPIQGPATLAVTPQVTADDLVKRLDVIRQAMQTAMQKDVDYGVIPGTDKPTLYKPGSEKLGVLFQLDIQPRSEKTWGPDDHLTVETTAVVFHAPTGARLGKGEGMCSTRERKYAYRQQERTCPHCKAAAVIKGKVEFGGGWLCWKKRDGCGAKFQDGDQAIEGQEVGQVDNPDLPDLWNCVTPETRVLTRDLRWVPAGTLKTGDVLIGVDDDLPNANGRRYADAVVTVGNRFTDALYEIQLEDGRTVRCNGEHRWLVKSVGSGVEWVKTEDIYASLDETRRGRPRGWLIMGIGKPWEPEDTPEAGYLAGLVDADGSLDVCRTVDANGEQLYQGVGVSFAQQQGGVLDRFTDGLLRRGFSYGEYAHQQPNQRVPVAKVALKGGFYEHLRFLGEIRPPRLLERWRDLVELDRRRFEGRPALVRHIEPIGRGELVRLGTSSHTYIAEGLVCHNTCVKMAEKRARVDAVLAVTGASALFTQDIEDNPPGDDPAVSESGSAPREGSDVPSEKQLGFLVRLLAQHKVSQQNQDLVRDWAGEHLTGGREGTCSRAIEALKGEDPERVAEALSWLVRSAGAWAAKQTDVPADTEGLPAEGVSTLDDPA